MSKEDNMVAHTQLPWTLHMHGDTLGDDVAHISGQHGCAFVMVHAGAENINPGHEHYVTREEARASARYIVTACNAYPHLVKALEEAREVLALCDHPSGEGTALDSYRKGKSIGSIIDAALSHKGVG